MTTADVGAPAPRNPEAAAPRQAPADRPAVVGALISLFVLAIGVTIGLNPEGVVVSRDPGYAPMPVPLLIVPALLAIALTLLLPRGRGDAEVGVRRPRAVRAEAALLVLLACGFPLLVPLLPTDEDYVLAKAVMFLLVPMVLLALSARRRGPSIEIGRPEVRGWVIVLPALVLGVLSTLGPFSSGGPSAWPPLALLLIAATATAITAGVGEELLYRRLLQTRLEALVGSGTGLLLAAILFGLMHVPSHGDGSLWASTAQALALQGTTGIALGLMWRRWRRLWVCILAHLLLNGFGVLLHLVGLLV
ncbi:CPBP family intramembrane glutamic endopeptidase [Brachybacterium sp. J153]|uniref:CPBP family intramembrane glutamic endopeptidase n=1 Tax=Brachybacterium sp. J153 TaxID=3116488 RepID=UPI002E792B7B|nr:CPBP family intramembrane glutamic endopeptidase [Brachybacterium sp. J153]MEE1618971.1 CPBP family intramembrane glutamic endopeptidase [Brachybacterium sp. J153]